MLQLLAHMNTHRGNKSHYYSSLLYAFLAKHFYVLYIEFFVSLLVSFS